MCGRFSLWVQFGDLLKAFPDFEFPEALPPRYNIAPTQQVAVVPNDGEKEVRFFHWGLIPFWAKDAKIGSRMINARAESLAEKPTFRVPYRKRRCLILADGFYEWYKEPGSRFKTPMYIRLASGDPFAFAGLWDVWRPDENPVYSCTIITTEPNELVGSIHNRMPAILPRTAYDRWLEPEEQEPATLQELLAPYPGDEMIAYPVSRSVNSPGNDTPDCIVPVAE